MKTTKSIGDEGEALVCQYLQKLGYKIVERNWRTKYCEIDIIAEKQKRLYFVEVKTRKSTEFGSGLEYITPKKLIQMVFAAESWVSNNEWQGEYQLAAASVVQDEIEFIDEL